MHAIPHPGKNTVSVLNKLILSMLLCILCATTAHAQGRAGVIYGRVIDIDSGKSLPSADISIRGTQLLIHSDQDGYYTITNAPVGEVTVEVAYAGYVTGIQTVTVAPGQQTMVDFNISMTPETVTGKRRPTAQGEDVVVLEKITVTTERAGNARAFMQQKNSMNMSNVMATDSYGVVQGGNVADFLKNVPGITLGYGETGEASTISIGGMDSQYAAVSMNGIELATGAGGKFDSSSRSFQFDQISINGVESITVNKTLSADMPGDKPAGGIDMRPKSAFDLKRARFTYDVFFTANSYAMTLGRTPDPAGDGETHKLQPGFFFAYVTPFNNNTMGLSIQFGSQSNYSERGRVTNTYASNGWPIGIPYMKRVQYLSAPSQKERVSLNMTYDWKISPFAKLSTNFNYSLKNTAVYNYNWDFEAPDNDYYTTPNTSSATRFYASHYSNNYIKITGNSSYNTGYTDAASLSFEWKRYRFIFNALLGYTYANNKTLYMQEGWFAGVNLRNIAQPGTTGGVTGWYLMTRTSGQSTDWTFKQSPRGIMEDQQPVSLPDGEKGLVSVDTPWNDTNVSNIGTYGQNGGGAIQDPMPQSGVQGVPTLKLDLRWDAPTRFPLWFKTGVLGRETKWNMWTPTSNSGGTINNTYQYVGTGIPGAPLTAVGDAKNNYDNHYSNTDTLIRIGDTTDAWIGTTPLYPVGSVPAPLLSTPYFQNAYVFDPHMGGNIAALNFPFIDRARLYNIYKQNPDWFRQANYYQPVLRVDSNGNPVLDSAGNQIYDSVQRSSKDLNNYKASMSGPKYLTETTMSGYIMGESRPWKRTAIQAGLRYEYTKQTADVLIPLTTPQMQQMYQLPSSYANDTNRAWEYARLQYKEGARTKTEHTYHFLLPSVNFKYNFTPNYVGHMTYNESFARVDVNRIAGNWSVNDGSQTATAPNPNLQPDHFRTYAASMEYYFEPAGQFTLSYTYRTWNNTFSDTPQIIDPGSPEWNQLEAQYGSDVMDGFDSNSYTVRSYIPIGSSRRVIQSLEIGYRQQIPFIPGLTVNGSFTRIVPNWRKTGSGGGMAATPKTVSASVQYYYKNFSINIRGLWTDRTWVTWTENVYTQRANYAKFTLDTDMAYRFTKQFSIYASGANVLNAPTATYVNNPGLLSQQDTYGASFQFGIKGEF